MKTPCAFIQAPVQASPQRYRRNGPCPCGSGRKMKKCCGAQAEHDRAAAVAKWYVDNPPPGFPRPAAPDTATPGAIEEGSTKCNAGS
jgi:hypothetical protein